MSNAIILSRHEEDGVERKIGSFIHWYEKACSRINRKLDQHDDAIRALRQTQAGAVQRITIQPRQQERRRRSPLKAYPPEFLAEVEALMRKKMTQPEIGAALGVSRTTVSTASKQIKKARAGDKTDAGKTTMTTSNANVGEAPAEVNTETP
jgi:Fic family protein